MDFEILFREHHQRLARIEHQLEKIMTALNDLTATVGKIETAESAIADYVATLQSGTDEAALAALNTRLVAVLGELEALVPATPTDTFAFSPTSLPTPIAGTDYSQAVSATSTDGAATLTVPASNASGAANALPSGATFDGATLTWPAASVVSGSYSFDIVATDSSGATATLSTTWNL